MSTRLASTLLLFLITPAFSLQTTNPQQMSQKIWSRGQMMRPDSPPDLDTKAAQLLAVHHDAEELSALSTSLQPDLQQLQKGILVGDLAQKLKKVEKLSKKLRQEVAQ
jgi:hypothetical protein